MSADMFYWRYFSSPERFIPHQATRHNVREEEHSNCVEGNWSCSLAVFSFWWSEELKRKGLPFLGFSNVLWSSSVLEGGKGKTRELCTRMISWDVKVDWDFEFLWTNRVGVPLSKQFMVYQREKTFARVSP